MVDESDRLFDNTEGDEKCFRNQVRGGMDTVEAVVEKSSHQGFAVGHLLLGQYFQMFSDT